MVIIMLGKIADWRNEEVVSVYNLRDSIVYDELFPLPNSSDKVLEWLCLKTNIGGNKKQILLLLYRPPNGSAT